MYINNTDALKSWLIIILEPLCDADSSALARYVLALLKKDKPVKELKKVMIEQLDVFLAEETKPFVEKLFNAIASEEYLSNVVSTPLLDPSTTIDVGNFSTNDFQQNHIKVEVKVEADDIENELALVDPCDQMLTVDKESTPPLDNNKTKELCRKVDNDYEDKIQPDSGIALTIAPVALPVSTPLANVITPQTDAPIIKSVSPFKATSDKENQPRESRRRRASLRSRSRTRSRSNDRISRRSRSRDRRPNDREKNQQRQFRNKSPPSSMHGGSHDRRRGGGGGNDRRRGPGGCQDVADRSPRFGGIGKTRPNRSNSRSKSPSTDRVRKCTSPNSIARSPAKGHHFQHDGNTKRQRCRDFDEKGYCVRGETCPWDHGVNPVVFDGLNNSALISMSLREYNPDAPDLWTRGGPAASLANAGVGGAMSGVIGVGNTSGTVAPGLNPFATQPGGNMGNSSFSHNGGKPSGNGLAGAYIRSGGGAAFRPAAPIIPFPFNPAAVTPLQRELIPVPVVDANSGNDISTAGVGGGLPVKRRYDMEDSVAIAEGPTKRKIPMSSRVGPRITNIPSYCSLELRKVPRGMNTIAHLNNHFAKFGKIINIQVSYDGDPEAAIVTFSTHAEANVAYRSTEAVLNNRFIKVFWHNQDIGSAGGGGINAQMGQAKDDGNVGNVVTAINGRKNSQYHVNNIPAVPTPTADTAKTNHFSVTTPTANTTVANSVHPSTLAITIVPTPTTTTPTTTTSNAGTTVVAATHGPTPSLRLKNNVQRVPPAITNALIRKKQEDQAKAVVQLANGLRKRKQELLQGYLKQLKSAVELVEKSEPTDPQRVKTVTTINSLHEKIEKLRKEIAAEQEQMQAQIQNQMPPVKKTKEQQKKELLDIELELFAQLQEGNDTTAIQKRLEDLQRIVSQSGGSGYSNSNSTGGKSHFTSHRVNNRIRSNLPVGATSVDRRPKTIVVTGFASEDGDLVIAHFKHFGDVAKHTLDKNIPQLIISYATRLNAEQAILRGKVYKGKFLEISWAPTVSNFTPQPKQSVESNNTIATTTSISSSTSNESKINNNNNNSSNKANSSSSDIETIDTLPELRLEDEEEDDESEDRSWRR